MTKFIISTISTIIMCSRFDYSSASPILSSIAVIAIFCLIYIGAWEVSELINEIEFL